jgi:segregation and condensation protein B
MVTDETLKALIEGIIYIAAEPVSVDAIAKTLEGEDRERLKQKLEEVIQDFERAEHGIQIRQVAGGYKFSSKAEHHEVFRKFVKSLKPAVRLSKPALETLAVIAYRQPATLPEIESIRGVDCGGVIHTLLEKKLVVTAGRKNVVGRPILYRTSRDFLVHFGLKDVSELPSLREFEEMARQALGADLEPAGGAEHPPVSESVRTQEPEPGAESEPVTSSAAPPVEAPSDKPAPPEMQAELEVDSESAIGPETELGVVPLVMETVDDANVEVNAAGVAEGTSETGAGESARPADKAVAAPANGPTGPNARAAEGSAESSGTKDEADASESESKPET